MQASTSSLATQSATPISTSAAQNASASPGACTTGSPIAWRAAAIARLMRAAWVSRGAALETAGARPPRRHTASAFAAGVMPSTTPSGTAPCRSRWVARSTASLTAAPAAPTRWRPRMNIWPGSAAVAWQDQRARSTATTRPSSSASRAACPSPAPPSARTPPPPPPPAAAPACTSRHSPATPIAAAPGGGGGGRGRAGARRGGTESPSAPPARPPLPPRPPF